MVTIPLIRGFDAGAPFAYREGRAVSVETFLRDAAGLADRLPDRQHVLNLCTDRYRFTVGFAAALLRGQVSLLPPNETPDLVARLAVRYPGLYCLSDADGAPAGVELVSFPQLEGARRDAAVPALPASQAAAVLFTSGSTGEPKPFPRTWGSMVRSAAGEIERLHLPSFPGMALVGTVPVQHSYGLE